MARRRKLTHVFLGMLIGWCLSQLNKTASPECVYQPNLPRPEILETPQNTREKLLFVGVMTAAKYLDQRALAVYETWGRQVPGKIAFFSSEGSQSTRVPLVSLIGVDDTYPPQRKSFAMLKYMHDNYLDKFEWFMRADDDVYVRTDRLEKLLRSVDSRKAWFIGQTGRGNSDEFGLLSLESDENFCMGGPGMILSRELLRRIGPRVHECMGNLYTTHEDVEVGRCVRKIAGVSCTWSYEMQVIFYHNQSGEAAFTGQLKQKEVHRAITLHPIKKSKNMYRLHRYIQGLTIQSDKQESIVLHRDIAASMMEHRGVKLTDLETVEIVEDLPLFEQPVGSLSHLGDPKVLGRTGSLRRYRSENYKEMLEWDFICKSLYSYKDLNPKRRIGSSLKEGLGDIVREVMEIVNLYSKQLGRIIDFKEILYGYWRLDPIHGVDVILDLLLVYRKYRGHKMTASVRRHAYIQQTFTGIEVREVEDTFNENIPPQNFIHEVVFKIGKKIPTIFTSALSQGKKRINFILPLSGRFKTFQRFLTMYEEECILEQENTRLIVVLYKNQNEPNSFNSIINSLNVIKMKYQSDDFKIRLITDEGTFSRGKAIHQGVNLLGPDDLLFFIDVDIVFNKNSLTRIRQNTVQNKAVYFPIVYSLYNLNLLNMTSSNDYSQFTSENLKEELGSWRKFGFGIVSLYKSDYLRLGGINVTISGWGFEDVEFFDNAIKSSLKIVRSADPGLVHIYHPVFCDTHLDLMQMKMCKGSQASTFGSLRFLQEYISKHNKRRT